MVLQKILKGLEGKGCSIGLKSNVKFVGTVMTVEDGIVTFNEVPSHAEQKIYFSVEEVSYVKN